MKNGKVVEVHEQYRVVLAEDKKTLLLDWKQLAEVSAQDFRRVVAKFADQCESHRPTRAVIDARGLNPSSAALGWVSGQKKVAGEEEYMAWWSRDIVPIYNDAGISSLAVATGNPNAPGEVPVPPVAQFKTGYFDDLESAMQWKVGQP